MKLLNQKMLFAIVGCVGLGAMLVAPASEAGYYYRHHWHPAGRYVVYHGCRQVVHRRFCRIRHGFRECYVVRRARRVC